MRDGDSSHSELVGVERVKAPHHNLSGVDAEGEVLTGVHTHHSDGVALDDAVPVLERRRHPQGEDRGAI